MNRTGKIYRARTLAGELIEGELMWHGKDPFIRGWEYSQIESLDTHAFGEIEVKPDSLESVDDVDLETMEKINRATYRTTVAGKLWAKTLAELRRTTDHD